MEMMVIRVRLRLRHMLRQASRAIMIVLLDVRCAICDVRYHTYFGLGSDIPNLISHIYGR